MLAAVWILVVVTVGADWWARRHGPTAGAAARIETVAKPAATLALGALAWVVGDGAPGGARALAVVAFAFCLAGDVALLDVIDRFVVGLASFLVGHVAFVAMFVALGLDRPVGAAVAAPIVLAVAATAGRRIVAGARSDTPALAVPVVAYLAVILVMALAAAATGLVAAAVGAALFVTSDALLGWERFVERSRWRSLAVMVTYHGALAGLALSLA